MDSDRHHHSRSDYGTPPRRQKRQIDHDETHKGGDGLVKSNMEELHKQQQQHQQQHQQDDDSIMAAAEQEIYQQLVESVCIHMACGIHRSVKTGGIPWAEILIPRNRHELFPTLYTPQDEASGLVAKTLDQYATEKPPATNTNTHLSLSSRQQQQQQQQQNPVSHRKDSSVDYASVGSDGTKIVASGDVLVSTLATTAAAAAAAAAAALSSTVSTPVVALLESSSQGTGGSGMTELTPPHTPPPPPTPTMQTRSAIHQVDIWGRCPPKEPKQLVTCSICGRQVSTSRFAPHLDKCMGVGTSTRAAAAAAAAASAAAANQHANNLASNNNNSSNNNSNNNITNNPLPNVPSSSNINLATGGTTGMGGG